MTLAIVLEGSGGPDRLQPRQITLAGPGPDEVLIRQTAIGVNYVDIYYRTGLYRAVGDPVILGVEGAGEVVAVGTKVEALSPGDRVAYMGHPIGAYAQERLLPQSRLVRILETVSDRQAAASMARGLTAHMLLFQVGAIGPGSVVLMHAGAGGLGQMVTRWARRLGARVIATVGSEAKIEIARAAGAETVILRSDPDWPEKVRLASGGEGVHLACDGIGGTVLDQTLATVRPFGLAASLGQPAGPIPPVPVERLSARSMGLTRPSVMAYANDPGLYRRGAEALLAVLADGLTQPIGAEYPLREAARAHADLEAGKTVGSVVLTV